VAKNRAVPIAEWNPKITDRAECFQIRIVREKLRNIVRDVNQLCFSYHGLARGARKVVLIIRDEFTIKPERERSQPVCFFDKLRHPRTIRVQGCGKAFDQCTVKAGSGFGGSSFHDQTQCLIDVEVLKATHWQSRLYQLTVVETDKPPPQARIRAQREAQQILLFCGKDW
jgi:hypothetical protein